MKIDFVGPQTDSSNQNGSFDMICVIIYLLTLMVYLVPTLQTYKALNMVNANLPFNSFQQCLNYNARCYKAHMNNGLPPGPPPPDYYTYLMESEEFLPTNYQHQQHPHQPVNGDNIYIMPANTLAVIVCTIGQNSHPPPPPPNIHLCQPPPRPALTFPTNHQRCNTPPPTREGFSGRGKLLPITEQKEAIRPKILGAIQQQPLPSKQHQCTGSDSDPGPYQHNLVHY